MPKQTEPLIINSLTSLAQAITAIDAEWREHHYIELVIKRKAKQRTLTQNKALHLFLTMLSEVLNDAGYDMKRTLKHDVAIPWTPGAAKEFLWRPIQKALTQKESTTEITTVDPTAIHETLCRHLGQKLGVTCPPWPKKEKK
jgi:hypothetical protein